MADKTEAQMEATTENIEEETSQETQDSQDEKSKRIVDVQTTELEENQTDLIKASLFGKVLEFLESEDGQKYCYHHCESVKPENPENLGAQRYRTL